MFFCFEFKFINTNAPSNYILKFFNKILSSVLENKWIELIYKCLQTFQMRTALLCFRLIFCF